MRSLLARLAVLSAFAVSVSACSGGNGTSLPFAGGPNNTGGSPGTVQTSGNGLSLLRFIQGSPSFAGVDVCVDQLAFGVTQPTVNYGSASQLYEVSGGVPHTVAVYPAIVGGTLGTAGSECSTAPGPYFGTSAIAVTTIAPAAATPGVRLTLVLGGTGAPGLYLYTEPSFPTAPAGPEVISHNAAPAFSAGKPGIGFGYCTTTVTPCAVPTALTGAQNVAAPKVSTPTAAVTNGAVQSGIGSVPAGLYDGIGVSAGTPVPITSIGAPNPLAGQAYVIQLYAIDAPAGGLGLVPVSEQTSGFGF